MITTQRAFEILGLPQSATLAQITAARRRLAPERHPDQRHGTTEAMTELNQAVTIARDWYYSNTQLVVVPSPPLAPLSPYENAPPHHPFEETISKTREHLVSGSVNRVRKYKYMATICGAIFGAVFFFKEQFPIDAFVPRTTSAEIAEDARGIVSSLREQWSQVVVALTDAAHQVARNLPPRLISHDSIPEVAIDEITVRVRKRLAEITSSNLAVHMGQTIVSGFKEKVRIYSLMPPRPPDATVEFVKEVTTRLVDSARSSVGAFVVRGLPEVTSNRRDDIVGVVAGGGNPEREIADLLTIRHTELRRTVSTAVAIFSFLALAFSGLGWWLCERRIERLRGQLRDLEDETSTKGLLYHFLSGLLQQRIKQAWTIFNLEEAVRSWAEGQQQFADLARTLGFRNFARFLLARAQQINLISVQIVAADDYYEYYSVAALANEDVNEDSPPPPFGDFENGD